MVRVVSCGNTASFFLKFYLNAVENQEINFVVSAVRPEKHPVGPVVCISLHQCDQAHGYALRNDDGYVTRAY